MTGKEQLPARYVGPVAVQLVEGKGRGLVAARDIQPGETLLVSSPLVYLAAQDENIPDVEALLDKLNTSEFSDHQLAWLRALTTGDLYADPSPVPSLTPGEEGEGQPAAKRTLREEDLEEALRLNVLALNMFGEASQDLPGSLVRGDTPVGHVGLWPEFSLLNHSCAPNAVNFTLGDKMVVRAAKAVAQGSELCINYLGRGSLRPATERLLDLREGYNFACACPRCGGEMDTPHEAVVGAVEGVYQAVMLDIAPTLQSALGGDDTGLMAVQRDDTKSAAMIASARARLTPLLASLDTQLAQVAADSAAGGGPVMAQWLKGSAFEAYSLAAQLGDVEGQLAQQAVSSSTAEGAAAPPAPLTPEQHSAEGVLLEIAGRVAPGSDLHLFLTVKALSRAQQAGGPECDAALTLQAEALRVVRLRYGPGLSDDTQARLLQAAAVALDRVAL